VILSAAGLLFIILAAAVIVDPYGFFGLRLVEPLVLTNRSEKLASFRAMTPPPQAVILGSSRVFLMDPDRIEKITGLKTFNASVSFGRPEDHLAMTRYIVEELGIDLKLIIVGVNVGELNHDPIDPQTITNLDLNRYLPISKKEQVITVLKVLKERFNARMVRDIFVALFFRARGYPEEMVTFLPNGVQQVDRNAPPNVERTKISVPAALQLFAGENELSDSRKKFLAELISFAENQGIKIRVIILPIAPVAIKELEESTKYSDLRLSLLEFMMEQRESHQNLRFFDATNLQTYKGDPLGFNDATHPSSVNIDRITDALLSDYTLGTTH